MAATTSVRERPTVAIITPSVQSDAGGVERFCHLLGETVEGLGWNYELVEPARLRSRWAARFGVAFVADARASMRTAHRQRPDLIVSNGLLGWPMEGRQVHVYHGTMPVHAVRDGRKVGLGAVRTAVGGGIAEACAGWSATRVAVSRSAAEEVRRLYRLRVDHVIPNGVDVRLFAPGDRGDARRRLGLKPDGRLALFVGRPEYRKGADLLRAVPAAGYDLVVAGPREVPDCTYLGSLPKERLALAYRASDCVIFPTRYEACSFVVLEALASGVPLVTTEVGWMREFVRMCPPYSRLVIESSEKGVAAGLAEALTPRAMSAARDAREIVARHFGVDVFRERWERVLRGAIAGGSDPQW